MACSKVDAKRGVRLVMNWFFKDKNAIVVVWRVLLECCSIFVGKLDVHDVYVSIAMP